jgi:hypothetical protein
MKNLTFRVTGEEPLSTRAPIFANFVAVAHVGSEVQFEFIYLDINELAQRFGQPGVDDRPVPEGEPPEEIVLKGKTVAKLVVPVASFVQLETHLQGMFRKFTEVRDAKQPQPGEEATEERAHGTD